MKDIINRIISTISLPNGRAGVGLLLLAVTSLAAHATLRMPDITVTKITTTGVTSNVGFKVKDSNEWLKADAEGKWTVTSTDTPVQGAIGEKDYSGFFFNANSTSNNQTIGIYNITYALADINDPANGIVVDPTTTGGSLLAKRRIAEIVIPEMPEIKVPAIYFVIKGNNDLYVIIYNGKVYGTDDIAKATKFEAYQLAYADHNVSCVQTALAATCTEGGHNAVYQCSICQKYFKEQSCETETTIADEETPATGVHSYGTDGKCTVCQAQASASVTIGETTTCYATLADAWDVATAQTGTATVKLLQDVTLSAILNISSTTNPTIILDLNDHVLTGPVGGEIIYASQSNTLTITDNSTTKTKRYFTVSNGTCTWSDTETSDYVEGGVMTGGSCAVNYDTGTLLTVRNVNFVGNVTGSNMGGAINTESPANIYNCTFYGNTASSGGAVYSNDDAIIKGCVFKYNTAASNSTTVGGGAVVVEGILTLIDTKITNNTSKANGGGIYVGKGSSCLAVGSIITMADGSLKKIEDVKEGEMIRTFDHEKGTFTSSLVLLAYRGKQPSYATTLTFQSGTTISIVGRHAFLCQSSLKYEVLSDVTAASYIGQSFYNASSGQWDKLVDVKANASPTNFYTLTTAYQLNCVANGMLNMGADIPFLLNIYELDSNLKADAAQLADDIATYGLDQVSNYPQLTGYDQFFDFINAKYLKIAVGKGLVTSGFITKIINSVFAHGTDGDNQSAAKGVIRKVPTEQEAEPTYSTYTSGENAPGLIVGKNVVVKDNKVGENANNVYLADGETSSETSTPDAMIRLLTDHSGSCIGVTVPSVPRTITEGTVAASDLSIFTSDDASKDVFYVNNQIVIMPFATPNTADYATYSASYDWKVTTDGVKAYKAKVDGTSLVLTELTGYIPAGVGVLLRGDIEKVGINKKGSSDTQADMDGNELKATTDQYGNLVTMPTDKVIFALGAEDKFLHYTASEFIHNRAYLEFDTDPCPPSSDAKAMTIVFADDANYIRSAEVTGNILKSTGKRIENGRIVIIKNGVKYTTSGQVVK